jgi:hypothetical protein
MITEYGAVDGMRTGSLNRNTAVRHLYVRKINIKANEICKIAKNVYGKLAYTLSLSMLLCLF